MAPSAELAEEAEPEGLTSDQMFAIEVGLIVGFFLMLLIGVGSVLWRISGSSHKQREAARERYLASKTMPRTMTRSMTKTMTK